MKTSVLFIIAFLLSLITTNTFAGSGTESDPYTIAEARALPENSTMHWGQGYIVGGRYDDFDPPYNNNFAISCADLDSESDVNNCLQVKLETAFRDTWGLNTNPGNVGKFIKFHGFRDNYGGKPSFEGVDDIQETGAGPADDPNIDVSATLDFGRIGPGTVLTQQLDISNSGLSNVLNVTAFEAVSGDTNLFEIGALPSPIGPNGSSDVIQIVYAPGFLTGVSHSAIYNLICNDLGNPTNEITVIGGTTFGEITIYDIQYTTNPSGDSPLVGEIITVTGIVTYTELSGYVISEPSGGAWNGVYVYDRYHRPDKGDQLHIEALVDEYHNLTELKDVTSYSVVSKSNSVPETIIAANDFAVEAYEGVLISVTNITVSNQKVDNFGWQIQDYSGTCIVGQDSYRVLYRYIPKTGNTLEAVNGVGWQFDANRKIQPRDDDDFVGRAVFEYALQGMVMTPAGPQSNWYVHILDDDIIAVTNVAPSGINIVDTEGIIFPGLIDAHNHPSWNSFPTLMFHDFPFGHRDEWGYSDEYSDWKSKRNDVRYYSSVDESSKGTVSKFAEVLELMGGCVAIQGNYDGMEYAHPDVMLFNVEMYPSKIFADIFPWTMSTYEQDELKKKLAGGAVNAAVIHLCEGPDATSHAQFTTWKNYGLFTKETTIIHGTSLVSNDFAEMAAIGAKLVWSPMSNMKLFDALANVKLAAQLGVNVGISPDWTPSGCYNLLEELGYAWHLNQTQFDDYFTAKQMCDMVTINNAISCGIENRYGRIVEGNNAGFCVIEGDQNDPYMALINARPKDVKLTIIDGTPRYGDADLIEAIGATGETVNVWGTTKMLNIAFDHPFLDYSQETFADIRNNLQTAHGTLNTSCPTGYLDTDELQFLDLDLLQRGPDNVPPFVGDADNPILSPANGAQLIIGDLEQMTFFTNGFWDNLSRSANLIHKEIAIVPAGDPSFVQLIITTNLMNTPANKTVNFTPEFNGYDTNYIFRFITADEYDNATTTLFTDVEFTVVPEPGIIWIVGMLGWWIVGITKRQASNV